MMTAVIEFIAFQCITDAIADNIDVGTIIIYADNSKRYGGAEVGEHHIL